MSPAPSPGFEVPAGVSEVFAKFFAAEYAYFTPRGEPLCWPVSPYWYPDRRVLGIATGIAYPAKADYPKKNPKVALYFSDPTASGLERPPVVLVQGEATVLDRDIQANTDRYVREIRQKFPQARIGINALTVRLLDFYLPRLWVEITPVRLLVWRERGAPEAIGDASMDAAPAASQEPSEPARNDRVDPAHSEAIARWVGTYGPPVLTVIGADGYPFMERVEVTRAGDDLALSDAAATGPAALTFHHVKMGGVRFDAKMARGSVVRSGNGYRFVPKRLVGLMGAGGETGTGSSLLSAFQRIGELRRRAHQELERRGHAMPKLRIPG